MTGRVRLLIWVLGFGLIWIFGLVGTAAQSGFVPITADNSAQVRLLGSFVTDSGGVGVAFSPDGKYLVNYTKIWNLDTWAAVPLSGAVLLGFSPDSSVIAVSTSESTTLVNLKTGETSELLPEASIDAEFSQDGGNVILMSSLDRLRRLCHVEPAECTNDPVPTGDNSSSTDDEQRFQDWQNHQFGVQIKFQSFYDAATFSPDRSVIAIYRMRENKAVRLIDAETAEETVIPTEASKVIFSANGKMLITAGNGIQFWSLEGTKATLIETVPGNRFVTLSSDESTLASYLLDGVILVYGVPTPDRTIKPIVLPGEIVPSNVNVRAEPSGKADVVGLASGNVLVGARDQKGDYVYLPDFAGWVRADSTYLSLEAGLTVDMLPVLDTAQAAAVLPSPTSLPPTATITPTATPAPSATPGVASALVIGEPVLKPPAPPSGTQSISAANLDAVRLLGVLPLGIDYRWSQELARLQNNRLMVIDYNYQGGVNTVQFWDLFKMTGYSALEIRSPQDVSASDTMLAYGDFNGQDIHLYDTENKTERTVRVSQDGKYIDMNRLTLSADGNLLAISGYGLPVQVWDLRTNELRFKLSLVDAVMTFVPDGSLLAVSTSQTIRFFNTLTGDLEYSLAGVYGYFIRFSPDGALMLVALAGNNHGAQVLDVKTGAVLRTIPYEEDDGYSAFSPDGQFLGTGTAEDRIQVWDLQTGNALQSFAGNGGITFSPDSTLLVTSDPFQIIDLTNGTTRLIQGSYAGQNPVFSADGATLLLGDGISTMVFGVPDANRPEWQPITGHIVPSGVNVRSAPEQSADVIGYASGDVRISGRNSGGVYLPDAGGWVWSDDNFLDLGDHTLADLPVIAFETYKK